ncbi:hypothetical protein BH11PSE6_BH11PSE6_01760 [soil metagenome]
MRVKVGNIWHTASKAHPIMVELNSNDRNNIANMAPLATKYALFADDDQSTVDEKRAWMSR